MSKILLYIAISQDGFIADKNGGVDWLPHPKDDAELKAFGYKELMSRIDTILMGSNSYQQIMGFGEWAWPDKQTFVFSTKPLQSTNPCVTITHDTPAQFMLNRKECKQDLWLLGGAKLAQSFHQEDFIDEIILTIIPQTLGEGIPLEVNLNQFTLIKEKSLPNGLVQKTFVKQNSIPG